LQAIEVLDLDRDDDARWMPEIREMIALEASASGGDKAHLLEVISDQRRHIRSSGV